MTPNEWQVLEKLYEAEKPGDYPADLKIVMVVLRQRLKQEDIERYLDWRSLPAQKLKAIFSLIEASRKPLKQPSEEELESWMTLPPESENIELSQLIDELQQPFEGRSHAV